MCSFKEAREMLLLSHDMNVISDEELLLLLEENTSRNPEFRRTAYPCRYSDLIPRFGRPVPELSMITNCVIDHLYNNHGHRITQWNHQILNPPLLQTYADAIAEQGAPLDNCFGFIDGTVRPIPRPVELQEVVFNGHKRVHSIKFQSMTVPSGLIANLFGPLGKLTFFLSR